MVNFAPVVVLKAGNNYTVAIIVILGISTVRYLLLILAALASSLPVLAETRYISDSLEVFYRSGPTNQYRILGTLTAGEEIEWLADDVENSSSQIRLSNGREVWIDTRHLMTDKPVGLRLDELRKEYQGYKRQTDQQIQRLTDDLTQAKELAAASERLQNRIATLESENESLSLRNQTLSDRSRADLMTAGGIVAIVGIIFGLILPKIISRRRDDGWR